MPSAQAPAARFGSGAACPGSRSPAECAHRPWIARSRDAAPLRGAAARSRPTRGSPVRPSGPRQPVNGSPKRPQRPGRSPQPERLVSGRRDRAVRRQGRGLQPSPRAGQEHDSRWPGSSAARSRVPPCASGTVRLRAGRRFAPRAQTGFRRPPRRRAPGLLAGDRSLAARARPSRPDPFAGMGPASRVGRGVRLSPASPPVRSAFVGGATRARAAETCAAPGCKAGRRRRPRPPGRGVPANVGRRPDFDPGGRSPGVQPSVRPIIHLSLAVAVLRPSTSGWPFVPRSGDAPAPGTLVSRKPAPPSPKDAL